MNEWWTDRSIPASRSGVREALETLDVASTSLLLLRSYGLSLSDRYWICPHGSGLAWDQVNFFDHPFSADIGDVLVGQPKKENGFDFSSPDNTSDGFLKKRWKIINGSRCLVKGGSDPFQQPFNEVIASGSWPMAVFFSWLLPASILKSAYIFYLQFNSPDLFRAILPST